MRTVSVHTAMRSYDVVIGGGVLDRLGELWRPSVGAGRAVVCSDENVAPLYLDRVRAALAGADVATEAVVVPPGEREKSLATLERLYDSFYDRALTRDDAVVALGGGVVGDLAGLAAATYQRGVRLVQAPTTLVAMVDASVGGKTAVDFRDGKNYVGAFYQPWLVAADLDTLATLPAREVGCGWAELVKHGFLMGGEAFDDLEREAVAGAQPSAALVTESVRFKAAVVVRDEREVSGERAILNLGHTVGHAVEAATGFSRYRHGEAVALGLRATLWLSQRLSGLEAAAAERGQELLSRLGLPERLEGAAPAAVAALVARDKKAAGGAVRFVLLPDFGRPLAGQEVTIELRREVLEWLAER